jgi:hypothetical protein
MIETGVFKGYGIEAPRKSIQWTVPCKIGQIMSSDMGAGTYWGIKAMRYFLVLMGTVILATLSAAAQGTATNPLLIALPFGAPFATTPDLNSPVTPGVGTAMNPVATDATGSSAVAAMSTGSPSATLQPEPQVVLSVHQTYAWQAYVGYSFFRFYESSHPTIRENQNGVNWSIVYFWKDWLGFEGEMAATYGHQGRQDSWFLFGGGGPRFRWSGPRGIELWGHALVGGSHFTPQTSFGKQEAFAYEVGGGADFHSPWQRIGYRVGADMVGSHYFSTYQYSPKVFAGIVFKF